MLCGDTGLIMNFSLQQRALHELAKMCWGKCVLRKDIESEDYYMRGKYPILIAHRNTIIKTVSQNLNELYKSELPKHITDKAIDAVFRLEQGYSEAMAWEERCHSVMTFTILNPMTAGEYQAGYFIDPSGHFNDLNWVKRFVADEGQFIHSRFEFACLYCLKDEIENIWNIMKKKRQLPCKGRLEDIKSVYDDLVGLWVYYLEDQFDELIEENRSYEDGFFANGLERAITKCHENAARFFWENCSSEERSTVFYVENDNLWRCIAYASRQFHFGIVHFIYSQLSLEEKGKILLDGNLKCTEKADILACLLQSPFFESALDDIIHFSEFLSAAFQERILSVLTGRISEPGIPIYKEIFKTIWNNLSIYLRIDILEITSDIIKDLTKVQAIELLELIILPLSYYQKEKMLLSDWKHGGISAFQEFSKSGDCDMITRYLLIFIVDSDSGAQNSVIRTDASKLINSFREKLIAYWSEKEMASNIKRESYVFDSLQGSLYIIDGILKKVEESCMNEIEFSEFSVP